jgi:hypothetical protein
MGHAHTLPGQSINMGRLNNRVPRYAQVTITLVIGHDQNNIRRVIQRVLIPDRAAPVAAQTEYEYKKEKRDSKAKHSI